MKGLWRCAGIFLLLALGLIAVVALGASQAARWLLTAESPVKADAIVVLAGEPARAFYAADLYRQGFADKIFISKPVRLPGLRMLDDLGVPFPRSEEIYRQVLIKKGVPDRNISFFGEGSISTLEEALAIRALMRGKNGRLLIVTSPYHTRRTGMIFRDVLPDTGITVLSTTYESFPANWWKDQDTARNVLLEMAKILYYRLGGAFVAHSKTSNPVMPQ